jgi:hypothetical protein
MAKEIKTRLVAAYTAAKQASHLPAGVLAAHEAAARWESLIDSLKRELEKHTPPDEFILCTKILGALRLVPVAFRHTERMESARNDSGGTAATLESLPDWKPLAVLAGKVVLFGAILWSVVTGAPVFVPMMLLAGLAVLDAAAWMRISRGNMSALRPPSSQPSAIVVETVPLELHLQQVILQMDSLVHQYSDMAQELHVLRQMNHSGTSHEPVRASIAIFQRLLGAARREHPELRTMVEDQCLAVLDNEGMKPVSHGDEGAEETMFDVQATTNPHQSTVIELYPAIVSISKNTVIHRGRLIAK